MRAQAGRTHSRTLNCVQGSHAEMDVTHHHNGDRPDAAGRTVVSSRVAQSVHRVRPRGQPRGDAR